MEFFRVDISEDLFSIDGRKRLEGFAPPNSKERIELGLDGVLDCVLRDTAAGRKSLMLDKGKENSYED